MDSIQKYHNMELFVYEDINEINPEAWNALITKDNIFHQHHFLSLLNESRVEDAKMQFLIVKKNEIIMATAVLSSFEFNLDLFIGDNRLIHSFKHSFPNFFKIKVAFCGTPISAGHKNIFFKENQIQNQVLELIAPYFDIYCKKNKIKYAIFKEFYKEELKQFHILKKYKYFSAYSLPTTFLELKYDSFESYLISMRANYRRQIKNSLKKINQTTPIINHFSKNNPTFKTYISKDFNAKLFYQMYLSVMDRAKVKLELLNEIFFENFFQKMHKELIILTLEYKNEVLAVYVLAKGQDELIFIWTGKHTDKDIYDSYTNLMIAMVKLAYELGFKRINVGQTSYYPKQRVGAIPKELFIFFKAYNPFKNFILRVLKNTIFPKEKTPDLNVFK